jgi:abortive infection bacteriophage resistance protein
LSRAGAAQEKSNEDFVKHFRAKYDGRLPTWVVTEILDFGGISTLYSGLKRLDRDEVALHFGAVGANGRGDGRALKNWLRVVNYVRNVCAHHSRLWNRNMDVQIAPGPLGSVADLSTLASGSINQVSRVFGSLSLTLYLLDRVADAPAWSAWRDDLLELLIFGLDPAGRPLGEMGFPAEWRTLPLWST